MKSIYVPTSTQEVINRVVDLASFLNEKNFEASQKGIIHNLNEIKKKFDDKKAGYAFTYYSRKGTGMDREVKMFNSEVFIDMDQASRMATAYCKVNYGINGQDMNIVRITKAGYIAESIPYLTY